jgi:predicted DNA-binding transcriptional regulator AlpA
MSAQEKASGPLRLEIPAEVIAAAIREGVRDALADGIRAEARAFLEDYFGCLNKAEIAAFLGVSERTVNELWKDHTLPKDTSLGEKNPRAWLPALKEVLAAGRIKARTAGAAPRVLRTAA